MINIQSKTAQYQIPTLGILLSMIFTILCMGMFIYFIDSISKAIQVDNILQRTFRKTKYQIQKSAIAEKPFEMPNTEGWQNVYGMDSGYLKQVDFRKLKHICEENNITIEITENPGFFFVSGFPIAKVSKSIDEQIEDDIRNCFLFYIEEHVSDHYLFGFKQISEIAVKALSPGINDPATATKAIDMLSILFIEKMSVNEKNYILSSDDKLLVFFKMPTLEELLFINLTPIGEYGKADASIMLKILESLKNLAYADRITLQYQALLTKYMQSTILSTEKNIKNDLDIEQIDMMINRINRVLGKDYNVIRTSDR